MEKMVGKASKDQKFIVDNLRKSNEYILKVWRRLHVIKNGREWAHLKYFGDQKEYEYVTKMDFNHFIKECFRISRDWFCKIQKIIDLKDGEKLFLEHGLDDMKVYLSLSEKQRPSIIKAAKKSIKSRSFKSLENELWPTPKKPEPDNSITEEKIEGTIQIETRCFECEKKDKENQKLKKENQKLKKWQSTVQSFIKTNMGDNPMCDEIHAH